LIRSFAPREKSGGSRSPKLRRYFPKTSRGKFPLAL
jgi:hypothetical protein